MVGSVTTGFEHFLVCLDRNTKSLALFNRVVSAICTAIDDSCVAVNVRCCANDPRFTQLLHPSQDGTSSG